MFSRPASLHRPFPLTALALGGFAALWCLLWIVAAMSCPYFVKSAAEEARAKGQTLSYDALSISGFPLSFRVQFTNLTWHDATGKQAQAGNIVFVAAPWLGRSLDVTFSNGVTVSLPAPSPKDPLLMRGVSGDARVTIAGDNRLRFGHLHITSVEAARPSRTLFAATNLDIRATLPDKEPKDHTEAGLSLSGHTENLTIADANALPFGNKITTATIALRVMGALPDFRDKASVMAWNNASGVIEWDTLDLTWGQLKLAVKGTLGLGNDLQPQGAFSGSVEGQEVLVKNVLGKKWLGKNGGSLLNAASKLFSNPDQETRKPAIDVPLTLQESSLFLGPLKVLSFPRLEWPNAP